MSCCGKSEACGTGDCIDAPKQGKGRIAKVLSGPEVMPPRATIIAVKRALGVPVFGVVRMPKPGGYFYTFQRIA